MGFFPYFWVSPGTDTRGTQPCSLGNHQELAGRNSVCWVYFSVDDQGLDAPQVTDTRAHAPCPALCEGRGAQSLWGHSSRSVLLTSASIMVRIPQLQPLAGVTETSISILHYAMHWGFMFSCLLGIFFPDGQWSPKARNKAFSVFWVYYIF